MALDWYVADLKTGTVLDVLPLDFTGQLERTVGAARTANANLPVTDKACPPDWTQLLIGGRVMIVPVLDDRPLAGYLVEQVTPGGPVVPISLKSLEGILEADYCGDFDFVDTDEARIAEALVGPIATEFGLTLDVSDCGRRSDRAYYDTEDRTVASAVGDLMAGGGIEWMISVSWTDDTPRRFRKTIQIAGEIGRRIETTVFANEHVASRRRPRDWRPGAYANAYQATGDGVGESRPMSRVFIDDKAIASGTPLWKYRKAVTSLNDVAQLDEYAAVGLMRHRYGLQTWELELAAQEPSCPQIITDFDAGDTVTMQLQPTRFDPASWFGPARVIGWRAQIQGRQVTSITPVFWEPPEEAP